VPSTICKLNERFAIEREKNSFIGVFALAFMNAILLSWLLYLVDSLSLDFSQIQYNFQIIKLLAAFDDS